MTPTVFYWDPDRKGYTKIRALPSGFRTVKRFGRCFFLIFFSDQLTEGAPQSLHQPWHQPLQLKKHPIPTIAAHLCCTISSPKKNYKIIRTNSSPSLIPSTPHPAINRYTSQPSYSVCVAQYQPLYPFRVAQYQPSYPICVAFTAQFFSRVNASF